ncbi:nuclease [Sphingomonas sp. DT-51]|uniref:nuclease n=1 Tax=Sphingomonas sp. DT-51 TaxID=3396165 RepID=UPI003F1B1080
MRLPALLAAALLLAPAPASAWGHRAHAAIDRAALAALPVDGPLFLRRHADMIADSATLPDSWRSASEPFSKIEEDPNHGWFREQFAFLRPIPRSRYAFVIALYREHERLKESDPARAVRTNVRWTGTLPYAAMESYGRLVVAMRAVRAAGADRRAADLAEGQAAYQVALLGHYIGDGAQPMHDSIHHDGWVGDNPAGYTRDRSVHGRFESGFVDLIGLSERDLAPRLAPLGHAQGDLFDAVLAYLDLAGSKVELTYQLEKRGGFADPKDAAVRALVIERAASGAAMLRDMIARAWRESASAPRRDPPDPLDLGGADFDPATGSAPPAR